MTVQSNLRASAPPQVTDDANSKYVLGSEWFYNGVLYFCMDATVGAAVWAPHFPNEDAWPSGTYRAPDNFGGGVGDVTPAADTLFLFPFMITRPIGGVGISVTTAGSAGAQAPVGIYPTDPVTRKPDGLARIGGSLTLLTLTSTGARSATFTPRTLTPGLYWIGISFASVTTMPVVKGMSNSNGKHVHSTGINDIVTGTPYKFLTAAFVTGSSAVNPCPTTSPGNGAAPMPMLQSA